MRDDAMTYPPLDRPKPVADGIWIVDGPIVRFGPPLLKMPFSTRMTLIRLADGALFVHSPTRLTPELADAVAHLGTVRWICGPNRLHYWWIADWHAAYPAATVYLAPKIREQAGERLAFAAEELAGAGGYPWDAAIATLPVAGRYMTEFVFFHRASRTLVLTDLIENFEPARIASPVLGLLTRIGHVRDPDGQTPRDMRATFPRAALREAVETMIAWQPERVIIAHGRWYAHDGTAELRRAFRWLLDPD